MIFTIIYIAGYLWFYRYITGYILDEMTFGSPDVVDVLMAMLGAFLFTWAWPILVTGRYAYKAYLRWGPEDNEAILSRVFPGPKEIETKWERNRRIERERREAEQERQREINTRERELGMELTKW